jgi:NADH-quinone oxidoreductase subunit E
MLRKSDDILTYIEKKLNIKVGESTKDNKFYLKDEMECLAACNGAPMMQINHINYENLTYEKIDKILDEMPND